MAKLRILSLDGGYRALLMCLMLARLEKARPGLLDTVDVFAGTSAGSAAISLIGIADTPQEGLDRAIGLFRRWNPLEGVSPVSPRTLMASAGLNAFFTHEWLYRELLAALGESRLNEAKRRLVVPTVELDNAERSTQFRHWSIQIYHNLSEQVVHADRLVDVVLRSSSVPLLHPVYQGHVDGGLFANNPSTTAVIAAHDFLSVTAPEISVLSIGQGQTNHYMTLREGDVGYQKWLLDMADPVAILNLVMELNRQATVYHLSRMLESRFVHFNPVLTTDVRPSADITADEFALQQELLAQDTSVELVLEQLDEIGWFGGDPE